MDCRKCKKEIPWTRFWYDYLCSKCHSEIRNREFKISEKIKSKVDSMKKAERIIRERTVPIKTMGDLEGLKEYYFYKETAFGDSGQYNVVKDYGYYILDEDEIVEFLIKNNFEVKKALDELFKEKVKQAKEEQISNEVAKIKARESRRVMREEAEKRVYGKVKNKRQSFSEDEKQMILEKFDNQCAVCGAKEGLHIHHKDHNPSNNQIDNLIVLCGVCHKKIHMKVR